MDEVPFRDTLTSVGVLITLPFGPNNIVATGQCLDGTTTGPSNTLQVTSGLPPAVPAAPGPCTGPVQAIPTKWVFGCGLMSCTVACQAYGLTCNDAGMKAVTTLPQAQYLAALNKLTVTAYYGPPGFPSEPDAPVIDYYGPTRSEYYWFGNAATTCINAGVNAVSQRICCCGSLADCPTS